MTSHSFAATGAGGGSGTHAASRPASRQTQAIMMFAVLLASYTVNAMDRMVFPVLLPDVRAEYHFGLGAAGLQSTMFALGMGLTGIPIGRLVARAKRKNVIFIGTVLFSAATVLTVVSVGFQDMVIWRLLSGVGEAMQLTAILAVAAGAFTRHRGAAIGSVNMAFAAGAVIGPALGGHLLARYDTWRAPMIVFGLIGFGLALLVLVGVRPWFSEAVAPTGVRTVQVGGATRLVSRNPMLLAGITVLFGLTDFGFIGMYATFLREELGYKPAAAGVVMSLSGLAAFASVLGGHLVDRFSPRTTLVSLNVLLAGCSVALFLGPETVRWQSVFSFLFGLFASAGIYVALAGYLVKSVEVRLAGTAAGLFVTSIYVPAGFAGLLFSKIVGATSWRTAGLIQLGLLSLVAAGLVLLLRPREFSRPSTTPRP